jgi:ribosomal protein S18 acetylase RimI-like enzyme
MSDAAADFLLRRAQAEDWEAIARVHAETWQAAYRRILPLELYPRFSLASRLRLWRGLFAAPEPPLVEVAAAPLGDVTGFAWLRRVAQPDAAFDSEIIAVAVTPSFQRRGLGRRLMAAAARRLAKCGGRNAYLWVYRDNVPARAFYEKLGGRMVDEDTEQVESLEIPIVAYAWKPIEDLLAACVALGGPMR